MAPKSVGMYYVPTCVMSDVGVDVCTLETKNGMK